MIRQTILLCFAALFLGAAPASRARADREAAQVLPMHYYGNRPAVEVRVNGQGPFLFLIDTGAGGAPARADSSLVRRLGLRAAGQVQTSDAGGATAAIDRVTLDSLALGTLSLRGVDAYARDYNGATYLAHIDGILGFAFFRDVVLTLDYGRSQVRIESGALPPANGRTIFNYSLIEGQPALEVRIGAHPFRLLLDTGNIRAIDIPSAWLRTIALAGFPRPAGGGVSVSGTVGLREVALGEPLTIGAMRFPRPRVTFADDYQEGNIGSAFWRAFAVTIDQRNRRVRLIPVPGRDPFD